MLPYELTKDTPYLALSGELWSVFYEYFNRNWPCYKGFLLYLFANELTRTQKQFHIVFLKTAAITYLVDYISSQFCLINRWGLGMDE